MKTCKKCNKQIKDGQGAGYNGNLCKLCMSKKARKWYNNLPRFGDMMPITDPGCPGSKIEIMKRVMRWDKHFKQYKPVGELCAIRWDDYLEQERKRYVSRNRKAEIRKMVVSGRNQLVLFVDCVAPSSKQMMADRRQEKMKSGVYA